MPPVPRLRRASFVLTEWLELPASAWQRTNPRGPSTPRLRSSARTKSGGAPLRVTEGEGSWREKHMFPRGAFVKMYYFAIEARDGVGYTLAALRCEAKIFENQQLATGS